MIKFIQKLLGQYGISYKKDIDLIEVEKIFNEARVEGWDSQNKVRIK